MQDTTTSDAPRAVPRRSIDRVLVDAYADHPGRVIELVLEPHLGHTPTVRMFGGTLADQDVRLVVQECAAMIAHCVPKGPRREVRS